MSVPAQAIPVTGGRAGVRLFALAVGAMDASTGLLLVVAPLTVLRWMWIPTPPLEPIWLRFIGAFVAGVGTIYLYALARAGAGLLLPALELTAIVRASVGLFVGAAILLGALPAAWLTVAVTDLALAAFQLGMVRRGPRGARER